MRFFGTLFISAIALVAANINRPMQRFSLPDASGHEHDSIEWKGKPMVIEFMATDCPHCTAFTSVLKQAQQKYGDRLVIIGMVNPPTTPPQVAQFISDHKITYPILLDAGRVAYAYIQKPAFDLPVVFLIDPSGTIRESFEYSALNADLFYGNSFMPHVDSLFGQGAPAKK